jgi:hypothetical protein
MIGLGGTTREARLPAGVLPGPAASVNYPLPPAEVEAVNYAISKDVVVVAAAGSR